MSRYLISNLLGLVGAIVGGTLGFYTFRWLLSYGYYGPMIPGAFLGLGSGLLARHNSVVRGVLCGIAALGLSLFSEYWCRPFLADDSFQYFVSHLTSLTPITWGMIAGGSLIAFWVGKDAGIGRFGARRPAE
jgi:hypothetical protein